MKVGLLAPEFLPNWGGVGTYCIELARAMNSNVDLHVITVEREIRGQSRVSAAAMEEYFDGRVSVHVVAKAKDTFLYNWRFQRGVERWLDGRGRRENLDLVHSHHAHMSHLLYGLLAKKLPVLTTLHTTIGGQRTGIRESQARGGTLETSELWQVLLNPGLRMAENVSLHSADRFVTMSRWMEREMRRTFPYLDVPVDVVPNGVDPRRFAPERREEDGAVKGIEKPIVLVTSRPTAAKGLQFAIEAMNIVRRARENVHFVFAGGGDMTFWRDALLREGVPLESFSFLGYLPYDRLPALYARAAVYLLPTLYENVPLRMLEAMSSGAPVVASDVCGIPEVIVSYENGILVPPRNSEALASAMLQLLDDPSLAARLGRAGRATVHDAYNWNRVAELTAGSYRRMLNGEAGDA